ncbi:cyclophilin-like fold protein [Serratia sp. D1N4]
MKIQMKINGQRYDITLYDNPAAKAFAAQLPMTLEMMELNGNEKYAELPHTLPASATLPGTIHNGDLMLYGSQTLVLFYATFKSSYAYTSVGRVDSPQTLAETIGKQNVRIEFINE